MNECNLFDIMISCGVLSEMRGTSRYDKTTSCQNWVQKQKYNLWHIYGMVGIYYKITSAVQNIRNTRLQ